jgi:tetratricopeptide (TPR) repeat protein
MRKGEFDKSKEYFNKLLTLIPNDKEAIIDLIVCDFEQTKDENKAVSALEQFIRENPSHLSGYKTLATLKLSLQKYPEAVDAFSRVLEFNPDDIDALTFIGTILGKTGEVTRAAEILSRAIELIEAHNKEVLYGHTKLEEEAKQEAEAERSGERKFVDEHNKGILGFEESKLPSKKKRQIADVDDDDVNVPQPGQSSKKTKNNLVYINDVEAYIQLAELVTDNAEREEILRKAHATNPQNEIVIGRLGQIEAAKGNRDEATRHIQRALLLNPANPKLYEICGSAALMLKNFNEALEYFQRSIQLNKGLTNLISANLMSHGASFVEDHTDYESGARTFEILVRLFSSPTETEETVRKVLDLIGDEGPELPLVLVGLAIGANRNKMDEWADRWAHAAHKEGVYKKLKDWAQASAPKVEW